MLPCLLPGALPLPLTGVAHTGRRFPPRLFALTLLPVTFPWLPQWLGPFPPLFRLIFLLGDERKGLLAQKMHTRSVQVDHADPAAVPQASTTSLQQPAVGAQPVLLRRTQSRVWTEGAASPTWQAQHRREPLPKIQWCQRHQPLHPWWDPGRGFGELLTPCHCHSASDQSSLRKNIRKKILSEKLSQRKLPDAVCGDV